MVHSYVLCSLLYFIRKFTCFGLFGFVFKLCTFACPEVAGKVYIVPLQCLSVLV